MSVQDEIKVLEEEIRNAELATSEKKDLLASKKQRLLVDEILAESHFNMEGSFAVYTASPYKTSEFLGNHTGKILDIARVLGKIPNTKELRFIPLTEKENIDSNIKNKVKIEITHHLKLTEQASAVYHSLKDNEKVSVDNVRKEITFEWVDDKEYIYPEDEKLTIYAVK